ncbi:MAG: fumarylacetoacetate hydrolase family protein [Ferrovibrio sp.]|uniref:fumarylacetoacetate hydrolase family protein n=1 Tax=Ferrovibrio sp. TaxID=1917215 RepID=UPI00261B7C06|nr:fumarylacetoacetate hydrolase family protein [Ferrovibrio sp.]MCW0235858.1 fumarylacetoacetate hydrolase family protein [Ferrovibrio sp.]
MLDTLLAACLPEDHDRATLVGRVWLVGQPGGPTIVALHGENLVDISTLAATMSDLLDRTDAAAAVQSAVKTAPAIGRVMDVLANTPTMKAPYLLAPCDLQAVKAAGVTFADSLIERVIEEQIRGDASRAEAVRAEIATALGGEISRIRPGSPEALRLRETLMKRGAWSQYLEVGIGPDAEVFTKCQPMASVGTGASVGIHPDSTWNNPEPEVVLALDSRGQIVGAALGNDVNLRDVEGRSALLLGRAKDNNASSAIGPFIRLFDAHFTLDDLRKAEVSLVIAGQDNFRLEASSQMSRISRDPLDLAAQTFGSSHQYPDGAMLFTGTMFAPIQDRGAPGMGFTHKPGDIVTIRSPRLGGLVNKVDFCDRLPPWQFGTGALMRNLAQRGLLR